MRNLLIFILFMISIPALSDELQCGEATLSIIKTGEWESTRYQIVAKQKERRTELWLNSVDFVNSKCVSDSKNRYKILINAYCGGSGCSESAYIIINAHTLNVELVPVLDRSNLVQAEEILGKSVGK